MKERDRRGQLWGASFSVSQAKNRVEALCESLFSSVCKPSSSLLCCTPSLSDISHCSRLQHFRRDKRIDIRLHDPVRRRRAFFVHIRRVNRGAAGRLQETEHIDYRTWISYFLPPLYRRERRLLYGCVSPVLRPLSSCVGASSVRGWLLFTALSDALSRHSAALYHSRGPCDSAGYKRRASD